MLRPDVATLRHPPRYPSRVCANRRHVRLGPHYATTLRIWREKFFANIGRVRALGCREEFIRLWDYYLCYCESGFAERQLGDVHMLMVKAGWRG